MQLTIKHDFSVQRDGTVKYSKASRVTVVEVTGVYDNGAVRTRSGDVWAAKHLGDGKFETVPQNA